MRFTQSVIHRHISTAGLLVALSFGSPALADTRPSSAAPASAAVDLSSIHIDNFGRIDSTYYRGAQPKGHDYADLAALGVKTLINLTSDDSDSAEESLAKQAGMKYVQIPMTTRKIPTVEELASFLKVVNDPASQPIYVHCVGGRHRTGVMTAIYRMTHDGWNADQAFKEMKRYKFGADFLHPEFKEFVFGYAATLAKAAGQPVGTTKASGR